MEKNILKKGLALIALAAFLSLNAGLAFAQDDIYSDPLKDIKEKLQEGNIQVVDYGAPGEKTVSDALEKDFTELRKMRVELGNLESEKSRLTNEELALQEQKDRAKEIPDELGTQQPALQANIVSDAILKDFPADVAEAEKLIMEIQKMRDSGEIIYQADLLEGEILLKKAEILLGQAEIKKSVQQEIEKETGDLDLPGGGIWSPARVDQRFQDYNSQVNYSRWGNLPERIISILEKTGDEGFKPLGDSEQLKNKLDDEMRKSYREKAAAVGETLSDDDIALIFAEMQAAQYTGEYQLRNIVGAVAKVMRNLIGGLAIIWIIISGVQMILAGGDETKITEQKNSITYAVIGLVAILLIERMVAILYGAPGEARAVLGVGAREFSDEVLGVVTFIKAVIGAVAILMIIISGVRTIFAQGEEEQITKERKSVLWIGLGLLIILVNQVVVKNVFTIPTVAQRDRISSGNVTALISLFGKIAQFLLGFVGVIAFAALIYGAGLMIINYGDEEQVTKGKKIFKSAIIGIIIIISAYTIVATMIGFK